MIVLSHSSQVRDHRVAFLFARRRQGAVRFNHRFPVRGVLADIHGLVRKGRLRTLMKSNRGFDCTGILEAWRFGPFFSAVNS